MPYEPRQVVLVRFPFTDQTASKQRPAVVVSVRAYNEVRPDIVIVAVTSQLRPSVPFGGTVLSDWREAGLLRPSAVKPVFATVEHTLVIRPLGVLTDADWNVVRADLMQILDLTL